MEASIQHIQAAQFIELSSPSAGSVAALRGYTLTPIPGMGVRSNSIQMAWR